MDEEQVRPVPVGLHIGGADHRHLGRLGQLAEHQHARHREVHAELDGHDVRTNAARSQNAFRVHQLTGRLSRRPLQEEPHRGHGDRGRANGQPEDRQRPVEAFCGRAGLQRERMGEPVQ